MSLPEKRQERVEIRAPQIARGTHRGWRWASYLLDSMAGKEAMQATGQLQVRFFYMNTDENGARYRVPLLFLQSRCPPFSVCMLLTTLYAPASARP